VHACTTTTSTHKRTCKVINLQTYIDSVIFYVSKTNILFYSASFPPFFFFTRKSHYVDRDILTVGLQFFALANNSISLTLEISKF
jgi:hypothetical protein